MVRFNFTDNVIAWRFNKVKYRLQMANCASIVLLSPVYIQKIAIPLLPLIIIGTEDPFEWAVTRLISGMVQSKYTFNLV